MLRVERLEHDLARVHLVRGLAVKREAVQDGWGEHLSLCEITEMRRYNAYLGDLARRTPRRERLRMRARP